MIARRRIGVLLPEINDALEYELPRHVPDGVSLHFSRVAFGAATPQDYGRMLQDVPRAARMLGRLRLDGVVFACTSGSLYGGLSFDTKVADLIAAELGCPASTTVTAVVESLHALQARRIAIATPYPPWIDELETAFFEQHGFSVASIRGLGLLNCSEVDDAQIERLVKSLDCSGCDALFVSCTGLQTLGMLERLALIARLPVVTSNLATLSKVLQLAGTSERHLRKPSCAGHFDGSK